MKKQKPISDSNMDKKNETPPYGEMETLQGQFLVAMPLMDDNRFKESVLFIVEHNSEGAMAIAINEQMPKIKFQDVYWDLSSASAVQNDKDKKIISSSMAAQPVFRGGPVQTNRGFLLHEGQGQFEGISFPVTPTISLSASMDTLRTFAGKDNPGNIIFALGYCGWQPGQLENELAQNVWLTVPHNYELLFSTDFGKRYDFALKLLGITRANLSAFGSRA
ncbi:MAG: YqgE/AlgH family protein [Devosiaceae bacterium]|nr:YqgE/AlgH family protein [Devosiaceae bacterium]